MSRYTQKTRRLRHGSLYQASLLDQYYNSNFNTRKQYWSPIEDRTQYICIGLAGLTSTTKQLAKNLQIIYINLWCYSIQNTARVRLFFLVWHMAEDRDCSVWIKFTIEKSGMDRHKSIGIKTLRNQ